MEPKAQKAAEFMSEMLYGTAWDFCVKQAVRHQQTLEEVLEHSSLVKVVGTWMVAEKAAIAEEVPGEGNSVSASLANLLPAENYNKLTLPENTVKLEKIQEAADAARKQVRSQISTLDGSMSLEKMAKQLRSMDVIKMRGTTESSVMIVYSIESAGEHEKEPRRSPTPLRRDHLEKTIKALLTTRGEVPDFETFDEKTVLPQLDPSDMLLGNLYVIVLFFIPQFWS